MCVHCGINARGAGPETIPAHGSAGVSTRQARFAGSDRQARGLLMRALVDGHVSVDRVAAVMRCDAARAARLVDDLQREELVVRCGEALQLPR